MATDRDIIIVGIKQSGFKVVCTDGTPKGTRIYYCTEAGQEIEITCANKLTIEITPDQAAGQIHLVADLAELNVELSKDGVQVHHHVTHPNGSQPIKDDKSLKAAHGYEKAVGLEKTDPSYWKTRERHARLFAALLD